jgi:hypothetical protein
MPFHGAVPNRGSVLVAIGIAVLATGAATPAKAQGRFGSQLSFSNDDYSFGIGVREWVPVLKNIELIGSFDCFFRALRDNALDLSVAAAYRPQRPGTKLQPYVGTGLDVVHYPVTYKPATLHLELIGGTRFQPRGGTEPFVELRLKLGLGYSRFSPSASPLTVAGGFLF